MQTIISVENIHVNDTAGIDYIEMELIKDFVVLRLCVSKTCDDGVFHLTAQKKTGDISRIIYVSTFPQFREIGYTNRSMIKWISENADRLIDKLSCTRRLGY